MQVLALRLCERSRFRVPKRRLHRLAKLFQAVASPFGVLFAKDCGVRVTASWLREAFEGILLQTLHRVVTFPKGVTPSRGTCDRDGCLLREFALCFGVAMEMFF